MKHAMKTRAELGKPKRKDFSFERFFNSHSFFAHIIGESKKEKESISQVEYDSYNHVDNNGKRIPAKRDGNIYRPQYR